MSKCDYFGRPMVKRQLPIKCHDCGRVVAAKRTVTVRNGTGVKYVCYQCGHSRTPHRGGYVKVSGPVQSPRAGSLL